MNLRWYSGAAVAAGLVAASAAQAERIHFTADLGGQNEVPPIESPAKGSAVLTLDTETRKFSWEVRFQDLSAPLRAAHFHTVTATSQNGPVAVLIAKAGATSPVSGSATVTAEQAADILAGRWYINIHTAAHPPGEIRGQVKKQ